MPTTVDASGLRLAVATRAGFIAQRAAIDIDRELRVKARPHRKTGQMESAIKVTHERRSPTVWRVTAAVPVIQAATTDRGARPHVIRPVKAKALRFVMDGRVVFATIVSHPGNKASHWFESVMNITAVRRILGRFVGR